MNYETIIVKIDKGVGWITFNKPPLNILDLQMMNEINAALDGFMDRNLKAVVIRAEGKAFSAGVDVGDHEGDKAREMIEVFHGIFNRMRQVGCPFVAFVNGAALGGGCEVAAFCDIVLASEKAKFGQPEIMVGVFPPVACAIFPKIFGPRKGIELCLTGDSIKADEAQRLGLVNHIFPVESFEGEAARWVEDKLASKSAPVLRLTKKAYLEGCCQRYEQAIKPIEAIYLDELMKTHDAAEGLHAFMEKRTPVWKDE